MYSIGDLASSLILRTQQVRLRAEMDVLSKEVATGIYADPATRLRGDTTALLALDRDLSRLGTYKVNITEAALTTNGMQNALGQIQERSEAIAQVLVAADLTPSDALLTTMSDDASQGLGQVLGELNRSIGGRFLFSGTATDRPAVEDAETLLADIRAALVGQTDATGVDGILDSWFDAGGGFETQTYIGATTDLAPLRLSDTDELDVGIRADNENIRAILKPLVKAALATDETLGFDPTVRTELMASAGRDLIFAQEQLVELRAELGSKESRIEDATSRNSSETTAMQIARLDLIATDPYDTATRFESVRGQLETVYAITARASRLSLAEYLR